MKKTKKKSIVTGKPSNHKGCKDSIETLMKKSQAKINKPSSKKGKLIVTGKPSIKNLCQSK